MTPLFSILMSRQVDGESYREVIHLGFPECELDYNRDGFSFGLIIVQRFERLLCCEAFEDACTIVFHMISLCLPLALTHVRSKYNNSMTQEFFIFPVVHISNYFIMHAGYPASTFQ